MDHSERRPPMPAEDEQRIVRLAQRGDREAFLELVTWHERTLYRLAYALTRDPEDAAAVARETFLRGWQAIHQFPDGQRVLPWFIRVLRGLAISVRRQRAGTRYEAKALDELMTASALEPLGGRRLLEAFVELPTDDQIALACRLLEDLSYAEIEAALQSPSGTVMRRLSLARVALGDAAPGAGEGVAA